MTRNSPADNTKPPPKQPLNTFESNKHFLQLSLKKFANEIDDLSELIADMANDFSDLRFKLCETFRLFGNGKSCYAGGEGDVQALCQGVTYGHVKNRGRVPKSLMLNKIQRMIETNDIAAFLTQCQSTYRAAQENEHIDYYEYVNYQQSYSIDPWEMIDQEDVNNDEDDFDSVAIFEQLEAASTIKAGNLHARIRPLNNTVQVSQEVPEKEAIVVIATSSTYYKIPTPQIIPCNNIFETPSSQFIQQVRSANTYGFYFGLAPPMFNSA